MACFVVKGKAIRSGDSLWRRRARSGVKAVCGGTGEAKNIHEFGITLLSALAQ
jgi:hypothetical protein